MANPTALESATFFHANCDFRQLLFEYFPNPRVDPVSRKERRASNEETRAWVIWRLTTDPIWIV